MDNLQRFRRNARFYLFGMVVVENLVLVSVGWGLYQYAGLGVVPSVAAAALVALILNTVLVVWAGNLLTQPLRALWQAIVHLSPNEHEVAAPQLEHLRLGRELVASLSAQVYQLSSVADSAAAEAAKQAGDPRHNFIAQNLPLPLILLDTTDTIKFVNETAAQYIGIKADDMIGKNVYMAMDMSFPSDDTFDTWLKDAKLKSATATMTWERVRLNVRDSHPARLFDLAAYYNRDNPDGNATMLVLFDHSKEYSQDEQAVSFMALSVHEMRTPLTLLRGYIEVFEEELGPDLKDPELQQFMSKMHAMAEQLTDFVNNILNVARVDDDQLELHLQSADWSSVLKDAVQMMSLRAKVRGITLHCRIHPGLPPVGIDQLSIREVMTNLIDNAIKYSGNSTVIDIETRLNADGLVETTVHDYGVGIPTSIMPNLFSKFYRDHRNRSQIGGTGLGLYLSKAIIDAHGGNIWVRSKEGSGSTFGFTVLPYDQVAETMKHDGDQEITRSAHGWIKNHSLYRR
ncbi:MAG TPA: PAS domain-containing sensor histidine kinase [Candidatus Saccharimonadales bacterium]|nr:PAS domain-containing sensor histidine kinase [Candidatus Saccharimonadales bacterium]